MRWQSYSRPRAVYYGLLWPCEDGGSSRRKLIAHHLSVQCIKKIAVCNCLWEAFSQGQWMHPIPSPLSSLWFNRERRGPQTELRGSVQQQQCGQVVNTQTWRGRTALQTGLISSGLSRPADRGGGGSGGGGGWWWWFGLLFIHFSPVNCLCLAGSVVIRTVQLRLKVRHLKKHCNKARHRQTGRQMHLEAEAFKNSWDSPIY